VRVASVCVKVVSEPRTVCAFRAEEEEEDTLIHTTCVKVVSELDFICILQVKEDRVAENSVGTCLLEVAVRRQSFGDCKKMKLALRRWSDSSRSVREVDRHSSMATEGHKPAGRKSSKLMNATEMDKELADIKREMEELEMRMRQDKKPRWVNEWPMKTPKVKWPVKELMVKRQQ
jgi:hypothetical protein